MISGSLLILIAIGLTTPEGLQEPARERKTELESPLLWAAIVRIHGDQVALNVGERDGVREGMQLTVLHGEREAGHIRLTRVRATSSEGRIVDHVGEARIYLGDKAVLERARTVSQQDREPAASSRDREPGGQEKEGSEERQEAAMAPPGAVATEKGPWLALVPRPLAHRSVRFHEIVPGQDASYDVLRRLAAQGALPGYTVRDFLGESEQLYTRWEVGQFLAFLLQRIQAVQAGQEPRPAWMTPPHLWALQALLPSWKSELEACGLPREAIQPLLTEMVDLGQETAGGRPLFQTGFFEGRLSGGDGLHLEGRGSWLGMAPLDQRSAFYLGLMEEREDRSVPWRERDKLPRIFAQVDLSDRDRLTVGREALRWGPGYQGTLLLSDHTETLPVIRYERDPLKIFGTRFYFTQFFSTFREGNERRWITARRFALPAGSGVELAFSEALKMQSAHQVWPSLVYVPLHMVQEYPFDVFKELERPDRQSNYLGSFELSVRTGQTHTTYFQWLLDDLTTNKPVPHKVGWMLGSHGQHFRARGRTDWRLEYTFIDSGVYTHRQPPVAWEYKGQGLGHPAGPDAQDLFFRLRHEFSPIEDATLLYHWARHGRHEPAVERESLWSAACVRDLNPRLSVGFRYVQRVLRHRNNVAGDSMDDQRAMIEAKYGF